MSIASSTGVALQIPNGTCVVSGIHPPANLVIIGAGPASILQRPPSDPSSFDGVVNVNATGVSILNLTVDGNKANNLNASANIYCTNTCGNLLIQNVASNNAVSEGINLSSTLDAANKTETRLTGLVLSGNARAGIYLDQASNVIIDHPVVRSTGNVPVSNIGTNAGITNGISNIIIKGADVDCGGGVTVGIGLGGSFNQLTTATTLNAITVTGSIIRHCKGSPYGFILQANNSIAADNIMVDSGVVLFNSINSVFSRNILDWNSTNNNATIGIDPGGCIFCTISGNWLGPMNGATAVTNGTGINTGSTTRLNLSGNVIILGTPSTVGIGGPPYDGGGGFAFGVQTNETRIVNNIVECNGCGAGITSGGGSGVWVDGNNVTGSPNPTGQAFGITSQGVQWGRNRWNTNGTDIFQVVSASAVVFPDAAFVIELTGTNAVSTIMTNQQSSYIGKVPWSFITNKGSSYTVNPTLTFTGGGCSVEPTATAQIEGANGVGDGTIGQISMVTNGSGCTSAPAIGVSGGGGGSGAAFTANFQLPSIISGRTITVITDSSLVIHNSCLGIGTICTRSGGDLTTVAGGYYQFVSNANGVLFQSQ
jgi:hypothetical protein